MKKKPFLPIDYVKKNKDIPLSLKNFSEVDTAVFAVFTLIDIAKVGIPFEGKEGSISFKDIMNNQKKLHGKKKLGLLLPLNITELLMEAGFSKRYGNIMFHSLYYQVDDVTQSTFVVGDINPHLSIVLFGGTDDSVVGWTEDLDLLVSHNVKCLENARKYVERNCNEDKLYILLGHSKGGMASCYAFMTTTDQIRKKIITAYDLDGPGFQQDFLVQYMDDVLLDKLKLICPRESFVGRLFFQPIRASVVKSIDKGLMQHNPTGWVVEDNHYLKCNGFSKRATVKSVMAYKYMNKLTDEEKKHFVSGIKRIAAAGNAKTLSTLVLRPLEIFVRAAKLPRPEKRVLFSTPFRLIKSKINARKEVNNRDKNGESNNKR